MQCVLTAAHRSPQPPGSHIILLSCPALPCPVLCTARAFVFIFFPFSDMGRSAAPAPQALLARAGWAGHDIETPTGLGTHKSARACYEPPQPPQSPPVTRTRKPLLASAYLASVTSACAAAPPCTNQPSDPGCTDWSSPRVMRVTRVTGPGGVHDPACLVPDWLRARQAPQRPRPCSHPASHPGDRPERCMCFFASPISHLPPLLPTVVVARSND